MIVVPFQSFADSSHRGVVVAVRAEPRIVGEWFCLGGAPMCRCGRCIKFWNRLRNTMWACQFPLICKFSCTTYRIKSITIFEFLNILIYSTLFTFLPWLNSRHPELFLVFTRVKLYIARSLPTKRTYFYLLVDDGRRSSLNFKCPIPCPADSWRNSQCLPRPHA